MLTFAAILLLMGCMLAVIAVTLEYAEWLYWVASFTFASGLAIGILATVGHGPV